MSQDGTYKTPEKIAIPKGACAADHAGSRSIGQNEVGTLQDDWHKSDTSGSVSVHPKNENPGALAGATGAIKIELAFKSKDYLKRAEAATTLCLAIADCDRQDACEIMEAALLHLGAGQPRPPLFSVMDEAAEWADFAVTAELKAYALACFNRMRPADQSAFLAYVGRAA